MRPLFTAVNVDASHLVNPVSPCALMPSPRSPPMSFFSGHEDESSFVSARRLAAPGVN